MGRGAVKSVYRWGEGSKGCGGECYGVGRECLRVGRGSLGVEVRVL